MYRDHRPSNNSFMDLPPLSVPPPMIIRPHAVPEIQMPQRVVLPSQPQAQQTPSNKPVNPDSERVMQICKQLFRYN